MVGEADSARSGRRRRCQGTKIVAIVNVVVVVQLVVIIIVGGVAIANS